jgi:hypothetical protein
MVVKMETEEKEKQTFIATVCSVCGLCKDPKPDFCIVLHNSDANQFIKEIVHKINTLRSISSSAIDILFSFEGFCRLFCRKGKCPLYDEQCNSKLSTRIACYRSFIEQSGAHIELSELSVIYKKWAGIEFEKIGEDLKPIIDINNKLLSKSKRRKLRKSIKKIRKGLSNTKSIKIKNKRNVPVIKYKSRKKIIETSFFCNSNDEWKEKISQYLTKNERYEDDNKQPSETAKCAGQSD